MKKVRITESQLKGLVRRMIKEELSNRLEDITSLEDLKAQKNNSRKIKKEVIYGVPYYLLIDENEQIEYFYSINKDGSISFSHSEEYDEFNI